MGEVVVEGSLCSYSLLQLIVVYRKTITLNIKMNHTMFIDKCSVCCYWVIFRALSSCCVVLYSVSSKDVYEWRDAAKES